MVAGHHYAVSEVFWVAARVFITTHLWCKLWHWLKLKFPKKHKWLTSEYWINFYTLLHPCTTVHIMKSKVTDFPVLLNESYFLNTSHYEVWLGCKCSSLNADFFFPGSRFGVMKTCNIDLWEQIKQCSGFFISLILNCLSTCPSLHAQIS